MIKILFYPTSKRHLLISFGFHVLLGFISIFNTIPLVLWFYLVLFSQLKTVFSNTSRKNKLITLLSFLVYLAPFEMLCRMANTSPLIPFELGKYLTFILVIIGIQINRSSKGIGYWIVFLTIPGILMGWAGAPDYRYIIFNILGIINLGLGIVFFSGFFRESKSLDIDSIIRLISYPLLSALIFAFFKTPNYDEIDFQLNANFDTSGGFGSNQVSTAFGLGMFLMFYLWLKGVSFTGLSKLFDLGLVGLFFFQGLLTFSRGGIIGGVLGMILLLYSVFRQKNSKLLLNRISRLFFLGIPIIVILAVSANELTGGKLLLRYQGETAGTLAGTKEKSANTLTSGRYQIFLGDLEIFMDNPIFGVGVNQSRDFRRFSPGVVAHVELSRLLSEHGLLGLIIFIVFTTFLFTKYPLINSQYAILYILFVIGFYTTFHAATRTFLSPLLMSIAYLPLKSIRVKA